ALYTTRRAPGRCGDRLAAAPKGCHVTDHRPAHNGAIERHDARLEFDVEPGHTETARRHLPRTRRACTGSLRLVTRALSLKGGGSFLAGLSIASYYLSNNPALPTVWNMKDC